MNDSYVSLMHAGNGRYEEKKSVFLAYAKPVSSEGEAQAFLEQIRSQYPDARHHVYAYTLRENNKTRYSDDGEPSGTAGLPVLDLLRKGNVTDAIVVVVRYFGGTLLGTGGLVRAYTAAAKEAVASAVIATYHPADIFSVCVNYADYQRISPVLQTATVKDTVFGGDITLTVQVDAAQTDSFRAALSAQTSGRCVIKTLGKTFCSELQ